MRVAVTGASGNVGTSVVGALLADERIEKVIGISRRRPETPDGDRLTWHTADVITDPLVGAFEGADAVIHLAWAIQPSRDDAQLRATNVLGSRRVFDAAGAAGAGTLVYASSVGAYSPARSGTGPVDESWSTGGIETSFYSRHKAEVEGELDRFSSRYPDVRTVRLRPGLIFKRASASEIRRYFGGPLVPGSLLKPGRLPIFPWIDGLRTQAVHTDDVAEAYRLAVTGEAEGAFNIAADPILDADSLAEGLGVRVLGLPGGVARTGADLSWKARLQPTSPGWVDMARGAPLMDVSRARTELGWNPTRTAIDAIRELLEGMADGAGGPTPPLEADAGGPLRIREFLTGLGARD